MFRLKLTSTPKQNLTAMFGFGLLIFLVLISNRSSLGFQQCHTSTNHNSLKYLATKTPYRHLTNKDDTPINFDGCEAKRIWMVIRHGTRNPGSKLIRKMTERLPEIKEDILASHNAKRGQLCEEDYSRLRGWLPHVDVADEKQLTYEGEDEMVELAERFQNRFPGLFPESYTNSTYKFQYTATQRTRASARHFAIGLFGRRVSAYVWYPEALHRDPILRFYKLCSRWRAQVDKNPLSYVEMEKFEKSEQMKNTVEDVSRRLGLQSSLSVDDVHVMYMTCSFETAWEKRKPSPWCSAFTEENFKVLEYAQDLEYYWIDGYGFNITHKQACPAFKDMMHYLTLPDTASVSPSAIAYFTHSGTLLKMLSHLGLYQDSDTLRHDNYDTVGTDRKWRVGKIDSFATNLAFVLYKCEKQNKILTLHQERPVTLPGCPENELCPVNILKEIYSESINNCDFNELCAMPPAA